MAQPLDIVKTTPGGLPLALVPIAESANRYFRAARSPRTRQEYDRQWKGFVAWCETMGLRALPAAPETVALYLSARADEGRKVSTLSLALSAISQAHKIAGHDSPRKSGAVHNTWKGIRRELGTTQRRVVPVEVDLLRKMAKAQPKSLRGLRDRALLCLGLAGAFRRSETVALEVADLSFTDDGLVVTVRQSKTDQESEGAQVGIPYGSNRSTCPVRSTQAWLEAAGITEGPVFRSVNRHGKVGGRLSGADIARAIKRAAESVGIDPAEYSGHSLRAGLATSAAKNRVSDRAIMKQGRWKSRPMVDRYVRDASLFDENAAAGIGL